MLLRQLGEMTIRSRPGPNSRLATGSHTWPGPVRTRSLIIARSNSANTRPLEAGVEAVKKLRDPTETVEGSRKAIRGRRAEATSPWV